jgi:transposase
MPRSYAPQFRAMVVDQVRNGKRVAEVAGNVEHCGATVFRWVRQDKVDRGEREMPGTSTLENAELRAAKRRIVELEAELATVKRASELFTEGRSEGRVVRPKDRCPSWRGWLRRVTGQSVSAGSSLCRSPRSSTGGTLRSVPARSAGLGSPTSSVRSTPPHGRPTVSGGSRPSSPMPTARW